MKNFNNLTPAETERLAILVEECGEVVQIGMKILRHGYQNHHPEDPEKQSNRMLLAGELGHVIYAIKTMIKEKDVSGMGIDLSDEKKSESIKKYLHHQAI